MNNNGVNKQERKGSQLSIKSTFCEVMPLDRWRTDGRKVMEKVVRILFTHVVEGKKESSHGFT